jgi:hypothetical protein
LHKIAYLLFLRFFPRIPGIFTSIPAANVCHRFCVEMTLPDRRDSWTRRIAGRLPVTFSASAGASEFVTPAFPHEPAVDSEGVELSNFLLNFPLLAGFAGSSI